MLKLTTFLDRWFGKRTEQLEVDLPYMHWVIIIFLKNEEGSIGFQSQRLEEVIELEIGSNTFEGNKYYCDQGYKFRDIFF